MAPQAALPFNSTPTESLLPLWKRDVVCMGMSSELPLPLSRLCAPPASGPTAGGPDCAPDRRRGGGSVGLGREGARKGPGGAPKSSKILPVSGRRKHSPWLARGFSMTASAPAAPAVAGPHCCCWGCPRQGCGCAPSLKHCWDGWGAELPYGGL